MNRFLLLAFVLFAVILSACGGNDPQTSKVATFTPDLCISNQVALAIKPVNDLQREFDDLSLLAANVAREQLADLITDMQRVRRQAEDLTVAPCVETLKSHQLAHMKTVIDTMIAFVGGADATTLNQGIAQAGQQHDLYSLELARLMGATLVPIQPAATP